jgi:spectrin alpha
LRARVRRRLPYLKENSHANGFCLQDPANIQSKHQKHQAFEAELAANADRIQSALGMGQNLIDKHQCAGSEDAVQVNMLFFSRKGYVAVTRSYLSKGITLKTTLWL